MIRFIQEEVFPLDRGHDALHHAPLDPLASFGWPLVRLGGQLGWPLVSGGEIWSGLVFGPFADDIGGPFFQGKAAPADMPGMKPARAQFAAIHLPDAALGRHLGGMLLEALYHVAHLAHARLATIAGHIVARAIDDHRHIVEMGNHDILGVLVASHEFGDGHEVSPQVMGY